MTNEDLDQWEIEAKHFNEGLKKYKHPTDLEKLKTTETDRILKLIALVKKQRAALKKAELELIAFADISALETIQKALSVEDLDAS